MIKTQKILNQPVSDFAFSAFEFVSDFDIRISDLLFTIRP